VYEYLRDRENRGDRPPTLDELCEALELRSRGSMHKHVQALVEEGLVEPMDGKQRGVRIRKSASEPPQQLTLFGYIAAGKPIEAIESSETIAVPRQLSSDGPCYVVQVKGDSMIEDGILDGDWVVVEQRSHARDGEIVVALVDHSEVTLKRIEQQPGVVRLCPANGDMKPLSYPPERVEIQGVVVGQMRAYR
jgi:repressor LexA